MKVTPHVAQSTNGRRSAIDGRTTRHGGYAVSIRKRIEEAFGWIKIIAGQVKTRLPGHDRVGWLARCSISYRHVGTFGNCAMRISVGKQDNSPYCLTILQMRQHLILSALTVEVTLCVSGLFSVAAATWLGSDPCEGRSSLQKGAFEQKD
jgi:hypothetical protein